MAEDLPINLKSFGTWPNSRLGTFWAACKPFQGTQQSTLDVNWANRVLENTSRVRGLGGTTDVIWNGLMPGTEKLVALPYPYFKFTPIVWAYPLAKQFVPDTHYPNDKGDWITSVKTDYWNMWDIEITQVYADGFFIFWRIPQGVAAQPGTLKVYWHAFGV